MNLKIDIILHAFKFEFLINWNFYNILLFCQFQLRWLNINFVKFDPGINFLSFLSNSTPGVKNDRFFCHQLFQWSKVVRSIHIVERNGRMSIKTKHFDQSSSSRLTATLWSNSTTEMSGQFVYSLHPPDTEARTKWWTGRILSIQ